MFSVMMAAFDKLGSMKNQQRWRVERKEKKKMQGSGCKRGGYSSKTRTVPKKGRGLVTGWSGKLRKEAASPIPPDTSESCKCPAQE